MTCSTMWTQAPLQLPTRIERNTLVHSLCSDTLTIRSSLKDTKSTFDYGCWLSTSVSFFSPSIPFTRWPVWIRLLFSSVRISCWYVRYRHSGLQVGLTAKVLLTSFEMYHHHRNVLSHFLCLLSLSFFPCFFPLWLEPSIWPTCLFRSVTYRHRQHPQWIHQRLDQLVNWNGQVSSSLIKSSWVGWEYCTYRYSLIHNSQKTQRPRLLWQGSSTGHRAAHYSGLVCLVCKRAHPQCLSDACTGYYAGCWLEAVFDWSEHEWQLGCQLRIVWKSP